jgi:uncharacterized membrane protein
MRIGAWVVAMALLIVGIICAADALTTTRSVWLSIPLLVFSGALIGPAILMLLALLGFYDLALEVNEHRLEFRRRRDR